MQPLPIDTVSNMVAAIYSNMGRKQVVKCRLTVSIKKEKIEQVGAIQELNNSFHPKLIARYLNTRLQWY